MRILGVSGSLRSGSYNREVLLEAGELLPPGAELVLYDGLRTVPPYDEDDDVQPAPEAVARLRAAVAEADGVLFSTPEYNASVPGQLKNAVDWLSRPRGDAVLLGKPVAVVGASTGAFGAVWAQADLRRSLARAGARVVEAGVAVGHADRTLAADGRVLDEDARRGVAEVLESLVAEARPAAAAA